MWIIANDIINNYDSSSVRYIFSYAFVCCGLSGQQQRDKRCANLTRRCGVFNVLHPPPMLIRMWTTIQCWSTWFRTDNRRHTYMWNYMPVGASWKSKPPNIFSIYLPTAGQGLRLTTWKICRQYSGDDLSARQLVVGFDWRTRLAGAGNSSPFSSTTPLTYTI